MKNRNFLISDLKKEDRKRIFNMLEVIKTLSERYWEEHGEVLKDDIMDEIDSMDENYS